MSGGRTLRDLFEGVVQLQVMFYLIITVVEYGVNGFMLFQAQI